MSKTLPSAISTGKSGDVEVVILVDVSKAPTGTFWWATRAIQVTDYEQPGATMNFLGGILLEGSLGDVIQNVNLEEGGNVATRSGFSFKIANPQFNLEDRADEAIHAAYTPYTGTNREVKIYMAMTSAATVAYADLLLIYTGSILEVKWDYEAYEFILGDKETDRHKDIPDLTINKVNYPKAPDRNIGSVPALIYGDSICEGAPEDGDFFGVPMQMSDQTHYHWIISRNKTTYEGAGEAFMYCPNVDAFIEIRDEASAGPYWTSSRPTTLKVSAWGAIMGVLRTALRGMGEHTYPEDTQIELATDGDLTTYVTVGNNQNCFARVPVPSGVAEVAQEGQLAIVISFGSISGTGKVCYWNPEWNVGAGAESGGFPITNLFADQTRYFYFAGDRANAHGRESGQTDEDNMWTLDEIKTYEFGIAGDASCSIQVKHMAMYLGGLVLRGGPANQVAAVNRPPRFHLPTGSVFTRAIDGMRSHDAFCTFGQGEKFGNWIDESFRSNPFDSGDVVDGGVYIIELLIRSELGLLDANINTDSFDDIAGGSGLPRESWARGGVVQGKKDSLEVIRTLCWETGLIYHTNYEGKESIVALSGEITPVKTIDRTTIRQGGIRVSHSKQENIYNEFELHYKKRWMPESFTKTRYVKSTGTNMTSNSRSAASSDTRNTYSLLCLQSIVRNDINRKMTIESEWIRTDAQADQFLKWVAEWFCHRKLIVEIETAGLDHLDLELGDQVLFDHTLISYDDPADDQFMLYDIRHSLKNNRMKMKFVQIPYLLA